MNLYKSSITKKRKNGKKEKIRILQDFKKKMLYNKDILDRKFKQNSGELMHIPTLISDLAVMMLTAGIITIIFKRIKQPLILGYILAGFLISPYFPLFTTVTDTQSIHTWSEIGIIFLMFHLGLEFNLHKLASVGSTAIITTAVGVAGMLGIGYGTGMLLGFGATNSICLGGMLAMSSTTIIIKVFDELKIKGKYIELVFGTLVIQDIVGIFMMVILSTLSASKNISGLEVMGSLLLMVLYLIIWLIFGIYLIPTFFNKTIKLMNDEMLLVVSIGICFGMVLLADCLGFSTALGAFLSGSLLAGTVHVERVETLTKGVKDLFGAVFFISVGMMVEPGMIVKYILPIAVITLVTLVGKLLCNCAGMLVSGQSLPNALSGGFALAQIGEFAFIIASFGIGLGVIDDYIYPIVVAVSVITTFTTPFCIKAAPHCVAWFDHVLPEKVKTNLSRYTSDTQAEAEKDNDWEAFLKKYFLRMSVYGGIMLIAALAGTFKFQPFLEDYISPLGSKIAVCVMIYIVMAIFLGPLFNFHNNYFTTLWLKKASFHLPLLALNLVKLVVVTAIAVLPLHSFFGSGIGGVAILLVVVLTIFSRKTILASWYLQLETTFLRNFNERLIRNEEAEGRQQKWLDQDLCIISFIAPEGAEYLHKRIEDLSWGANYNVYVVKIRHEGKYILLPDGKVSIKPMDKVYVVGEEKALLNFYRLTGLVQNKPIRTLKKFMESAYPKVEHALAVSPIKVRGDENFANKPIKQGHLRESTKCMILGIQKDGYPIIMPDANMLISKGDILWVMGSNNNVGALIGEYVE